MLSNAYFLAKFRFDTAENEPAKNLQNFRKMHFREMHFRKMHFRPTSHSSDTPQLVCFFSYQLRSASAGRSPRNVEAARVTQKKESKSRDLTLEVHQRKEF